MPTPRTRLVAALAAGALLLALPACKSSQRSAPEQPAAQTPSSDDARMAWWRDARFGMFIHWGIYAQAAGEWNGKPVDGAGEWIMHTAKIPVAEYEPLAREFNPVKFNAKQWVSIAKNAGMKYIVITSKHHDGFSMFDTQLTGYDIVDATPFRRDPLKELALECQRQGIRLCFYHSIMDWHHPDENKERFSSYVPHMKGQIRELLTNYGPIGVLWFDGEWIEEWTEDQGQDLYAYCRSLQPSIIVNNRVGKGRAGMAGMSKDKDAAGDFGTPEQEIPGRGFPGMDWESCMTMNDTWGFKKSDHNWKSNETLIRMLIESSSKGGNFLLNVGPTALGEIPEPSVERLAAVGDWMKTNSASIYGTSAGPFDRLPWGRCTARPGTLYLHVFDWPADGKLIVPGLRNHVERAYLLSDKRKSSLPVTRTEDGIALTVSMAAPDPVASVVVLDIRGEPEVITPPISAGPDGSIQLIAMDATVHGTTAHWEGHDRDYIGFWTNPADSVSWEFAVPAAGAYAIEITTACTPGEGGSTYRVRVGGREFHGAIEETGAWTDFRTDTLGNVQLRPGRHALHVEPITMAHGAVMNLKSIRLIPVK